MSSTHIYDLCDDIFLNMYNYLSADDIFNIINTSDHFANMIVKYNYKIIKSYISLDDSKILLLANNINKLPFKSIILDYTNINNQSIEKYLSLESDIINLKIRKAGTENNIQIYDIIDKSKNINSITFDRCNSTLNNIQLPHIPSLQSISFINCNDNIFNMFINQQNIECIYIENNDWTWNGFPHDTLNDIMKKSNNVKKLILRGSGTGSYFDSDEFPYTLCELDSTMITFHWYVGISGMRNNFLATQLNHLKKLTIHELPMDFDGGRVLKYIYETMNLEEFHYKLTPLISKKIIQKPLKKIEFTELNITSVCYLANFSIKSLTLILSQSDIASSEIERNINPYTNIFNSVDEFELIDNSKYRATFGVFLGLMNNLRNIKKLTLKTQDRNINTLLGEFLPKMPNLEELYIDSIAPRFKERFRVINNTSHKLKKIIIDPSYIDEASTIFHSTVNICSINNIN